MIYWGLVAAKKQQEDDTYILHTFVFKEKWTIGTMVIDFQDRLITKNSTMMYEMVN